MCARIAISAVWRMYVDLPPMFGPVTISIRVRSSSTKSFGTNGAELEPSTPRCRPARYSSTSSSLKLGLLKRSAPRALR